MNDIRCYVCGKPIRKEFTLLAMSKGVDRVFVMHTGSCALRVRESDAVVEIKVRRVE